MGHVFDHVYGLIFTSSENWKYYQIHETFMDWLTLLKCIVLITSEYFKVKIFTNDLHAMPKIFYSKNLGYVVSLQMIMWYPITSG